MCMSIHFAQLSCTVNEVHYPLWTEGTNVFVTSRFASANGHRLRTLSVAVPYTFSVKPKWRMAVLLIFAADSSAIAYLRTLIPVGNSTVNFPELCTVLLH